MRYDEIEVLKAYNAVLKHGHGQVVITIAQNGESIDIQPMPRTRVKVEWKPKDTKCPDTTD